MNDKKKRVLRYYTRLKINSMRYQIPCSQTCTRAAIIRYDAFCMGTSKDILKERRKVGRKERKAGRQAPLAFAGRMQAWQYCECWAARGQ